MFCPKCGRQQASDQVRFCSSCGFQLHGVTDLLINNGFLPAQQMPVSKSEPFFRRKSMRFGAKLMFLSVVLIPVILALSILLDSPGPLFIPVTLFLGGLSWVAYHKIFESDPQLESGKQNFIAYPPQPFNQALPPMYQSGEPIYGERRLNTADMAAPPSVTENTTRHLPNKNPQ